MKKYLPTFLSIAVLFLAVLFPFSVSAQTSGADLIITNLQLTDAQGNIKTSFQPNEPIYYRITIANQGTERTADRYDNQIYHTYYRNSPQPITSCATPSDPRNFYSYSTTNFPASSSFVYESRPGGIKEAQFPGVRSFTQNTPGTYTARAYVDYDCRAIEANDSNNQRTVSYTIIGQATPTPTVPPAPTPTPTQASVAVATPTLAAQQAPVAGTTQSNTTPTPGSQLAMNTALPEEGAWIIDSEVTKIGKNASRSGMLLDWTLRDYQWAYVRDGDTNPLIPFWLIIQRIVYALFLFVILVTAFILIVTRGKSLAAKRFFPRFLLVVLLVTFSFSLVQLLYQITDIFQGFFLKNPQGNIISSRDLLFIGWDYRDFQGLRRFGEEFEESALMSLLFVKLTAFTYYVMAVLLVVRKIILWFFIVLSPVFPLLLLFYPIRNTAKIWIGEFFRWLLYAPLFAIFLSGLVRLWQTSLPLAFNFAAAGKEGQIVYPTVVGILLGGPRQNVSLLNSLNVPDTFALYLVALLMLWVVIILPFILLQIFLEYMYNVNFKESPYMQQLMGRVSNRFAPVTNPSLPPGTPPPTRPAGLARSLPFNKHYAIPKTTGLAKSIPRGESQRLGVPRPLSTQLSRSQEIMRLVNVSMPTMRDVARFDTARLTQQVRTNQETARLQQILQRIANPASVTSTTERESARMIRERLVTESQKGNQIASTILQAAQTMSSHSAVSSVVNQTQNQNQALTTLITQLAQPQSVTTIIEREKVTSLKERIEREVRNGSQLATTLLNAVNAVATNSTSSLRETLSYLSKPESISRSEDKQVYQQLREKIVTGSQSGNELASLIVNSLERSTSSDQVRLIQEKLLQAQSQGSQLAQEILNAVTTTSLTTITNITNNQFSSLRQGLAKLSRPETITNQDEQRVYQQLREKIVTASQSGNELATLLSSALESTTSEEQVKTIQEKLVTAQKEGSQLATELLSTIEKTTEKDQSSQLEVLQTRLEEAKKQGDPLATTLLQMLSVQKQNAITSKAPIKAIQGQRKSGFPVVNRLQQVSLDDYEAVRKLWKDNYQNLDVPQSLAGERTRRQWISGDITDIQQTISLLTSNNAEEVEEGMQKVSEILPFLLMGGFSQTEIIAYLKAKMEAGKGVLEELEKTASEEDTLVAAKRVTSSPAAKSQHMTTSVAIDNTTNINTTNVSNTTENTYSDPVTTKEYHTVQTSSTHHANPAQQSTVAPYVSQILQMSQLSLPSLKDIVKYERDLQSQSSSQESQALKTVLIQLGHPERVQDRSLQEQLRMIRETLQKQSQAGDTMATTLISATEGLSTEGEGVTFTTEDSELFLSMLKDSVTSNENVSKSEEYQRVQTLLKEARKQGNPLAEKVMTLVESSEKAETQALQIFLQKIAHPENVHTATERMQYTKLRERLGEASDNRDSLASSILHAAQGNADIKTAQELKQTFGEAVSKDDPLATYIMTTLLSPSEKVREQITTVYKELLTQKKTGDQLASLLVQLLRKKQKQKTGRKVGVILPRENRLQQVSLDDYEAVKTMWYDNYLHAEVPLSVDGKEQTRIEWIQADMVSITETINLLSSSESEQQEEGMERVSAILPFLLIGGFTKLEVLGYLKAKLEAAKMALLALQNQATQEEVAVRKGQNTTESQQAQAALELPKKDEEENLEKGEKDIEESAN